MPSQQEPDEPTEKRKEISVARKTRRYYGSGCVIKRGKGFTIRWRETVVCSDGTKRTVYRCEALGAVSKKKANSVLSERVAAAQTEVRSLVTFKDLATSWKSTVLPFYKYSSREVREITLNKLLSRFGEMHLESVTRQEIQPIWRNSIAWNTHHIRFTTCIAS